MKKIILALSIAALGFVHSAYAEEQPDQRASIRTNLATEYYKMGQYAIAIDEAKKAVAANSKYFQAYNLLALSYWALKDNGTAETYFKQAIEIAPTDSDLNHNYGNFLCASGNPSAALARFNVALQNPLYGAAENTMQAAGNCAIKNNDVTAAIAWFQRILQNRPDNLSAKFNLSNLLLKSGDLPEAKRIYLEVYKTLRPAPAELLWLGVRIEHAIGNKGAEERYGSELKNKYPDSVEATKLQIGKYD